MSKAEINAMLKRVKTVLKQYPDNMILMDIRVQDGNTGPTPDEWRMEVDQEYGVNRLRIGVIGAKK